MTEPTLTAMTQFIITESKTMGDIPEAYDGGDTIEEAIANLTERVRTEVSRLGAKMPRVDYRGAVLEGPMEGPRKRIYVYRICQVAL